MDRGCEERRGSTSLTTRSGLTTRSALTTRPGFAGRWADERAAPLLIEGYAALFGVADLSGDVVRAGAFAGALRRGGVAMLLQHRTGAVAGRWTRLAEDGRGLFVRGLIERPGAQALARAGVDGLSIGFRPQIWGLRPGGGRDLKRVELIEVSLVARPMQPKARFSVIGAAARAA